MLLRKLSAFVCAYYTEKDLIVQSPTCKLVYGSLECFVISRVIFSVAPIYKYTHSGRKSH